LRGCAVRFTARRVHERSQPLDGERLNGPKRKRLTPRGLHGARNLEGGGKRGSGPTCVAHEAHVGGAAWTVAPRRPARVRPGTREEGAMREVREVAVRIRAARWPGAAGVSS